MTARRSTAARKGWEARKLLAARRAEAAIAASARPALDPRAGFSIATILDRLRAAAARAKATP